MGWLNRQAAEIQAAVKTIAESKMLPSMILEWADSDVVEMYRLTTTPPTQSHHEARLERLASKAKQDKAESVAFARGART